MAYIYKITNDVNGKVYIGQTSFSIEKRFKQHLKEYKKERCEKRPLYSAIRKYGPEHFHIEMIEETDQPLEREKYWIKYYNSYGNKNGYNATMGGDGKSYIDHDLVIQEYIKIQNQNAVAKKLGISPSSVHTILKSNNIKMLSKNEVAANIFRKSVAQYSLEGKLLQTFDSVSNAARAIGKIGKMTKGATTHITECCKGKRGTAYGYKWKFL